MLMLKVIARRRVLWFVVVASSAALSLYGAQAADAPAASGTSNLKVFELPDKSASILLPEDWHVVQTGVAYARARGPNGEFALFGAIVPAHNSSGDSGPTVLNQSYSADNKDKFIQSVNFLLAHVGLHAVPIQIVTDKKIAAPDAFGTCTKFTALMGANGGVAAEADFCSLPMEKKGDYQNFFKLVAVQARLASQERAMLEKILMSYALEGNVVKRSKALKAAGSTAPGPAGMAGVANSAMSMALINAQTRAIQSATWNSTMGSLRSASDFDHAILRGETPIYAQGVDPPLFWVGGD